MLKYIRARSLFWLNVFLNFKVFDLGDWLNLLFSAIVDTLIYSMSLCKLNPSPRILGCSIIYAKYYGAFFSVRGGSDDLYNVMPQREDDVHDFILNSLKECDIFVDIGANIGYYTILGAKAVGNEGLVIAVEPVPETVNVLKTNVRLNGLSNVMLISKAAWNTTTSLRLSIPIGLFGWASSVQPYVGKPVTVSTISIDELCTNMSNIKLMKLDVEGAEYEILLGAKKTLLRTQLLAIELTKNVERTLSILKKLNFECKKAKFGKNIICRNNKFCPH